MKIAYIQNNHSWSTFTQKLKNIATFYSSITPIKTTTFQTYFTAIPFVTVPTSDGHQGSQDTLGTAETVDPQWYNTNVVPLATDADVIVFCLSKEDCDGHINPTGIDDKNHIVMFGMDENAHAYINGVDLGNEFEFFCEHEISHYLFYIRGLVDRTHEFFYAGNPQGVLPFLKVTNKTLFQNLLDVFKQLFNLTQPPMQQLFWDTPQNCRHSIRVMCDNTGLSVHDKEIITACIRQESNFNPKAVGVPNSNGTIDYGICQFNNGVNHNGTPFWIGPGADFPDTKYVLDNPDKCVSVMIREYKSGHIGWWSSFSTGAYKQWLP